ncbi:MAG: molybdopterin-dependent oxidoreductase [Ignavibacteriae bacterium]|nr:molybdopterin-dependent oxidoreductase [Ignavibacteriota bacterium]
MESISEDHDSSRRSFLLGMAATGALAFSTFSNATGELMIPEPSVSFEPNTWVKIDPDGTTTITVAKSEMGQGVRTSLAMIIAEEMDADWSKVKVRQARPDTGNGGLFTGGSGSVIWSYDMLRKAGATVKAMLISAAAKKWNVAESNCMASSGVISEKNGSRKILYGELTDDAAKISVPSNPSLKSTGDFKLIGTPKPHIDNPDVVSGKAKYGLDVRIPGMKFAVMVRMPAYGASISSFDATETLKLPGILKAENVQGVGLVVLADNTYAALKGREALKIEWNMGSNATLNSAKISEQMKSGIGTVADVPASSAKKIEAHYELPYLAHATMEVMNCVADIRQSSAEIWCPTQVGDDIRNAVANVTGLSANSITVNTTLLGGGFGRRLNTDYASIAARISKAFKVPVLFMFSRQDDMRGDAYRPASYHICKGGLDSTGKVTGWVHKTVNGEASNPPYQIQSPNSNSTSVGLPIPTGAWRSVGHTSSIFVNECFIDELAVAAGKDPFEFRHNLLPNGKLKTVLEKVAELAEWTKPLPKGWGRGIACTDAYSAIAHVVEVSVSNAGILKVERIVAVVDCGIAINPMGVEAQIQGASVDALSTALKSEITIENGGVKQSTFRDFEWLRMNEMPKVEVHIIPSTASPNGMGEAGFPSVSPALCNAIFNATGIRVRTLPIQKTSLAAVDDPEINNNIGEINVFPSPFTSFFKVEGQLNTASSGEVLISIQNLLGSTLLETSAPFTNNGKFSQEINFSPASAGVYFLTVKSGSALIMRKIVKE